MKRIKKSVVLLLCILVAAAAVPRHESNFLLFAHGEETDETHVHSFVKNVVSEPTCTEEGLEEFTCACGYSYTQVLPATGHTEYRIAPIAPTCTKSGLTEAVKCSVCNAVITEQAYIEPLGHEEEEIPEVLPKCSKTGLTAGIKCSRCGEILKEQETVAALGHSMGQWIVKTQPTCLENGTNIKYCSRCDYYITQDTPATGHTLSQWITDTEPDCVNPGTRHIECTVCNLITKTENIPATGHSYIKTVTPPTCTTNGYTFYLCTVCGSGYADEIVNATGHKEVTDEAVEPTCTKSGLTEGSHCSVCGEIITQQAVIAAKGHTKIVIPKVDPTCTEPGLSEGVKCSVCGEILTKQETLEPLGHEMGQWLAVINPTCTEGGVMKSSCTRCDYFETAEINAVGHIETAIEKVNPTCTESGLTEGIKCGICGEVIKIQQVIDSLGHDMGQWIVTTAPTCTQEGVETRFCSRCDYIETRAAAPTGHTQSEWIIDKDSDCVSIGTKHIECIECKEVLKTQNIPVKEHSFIINETPSTCVTDGFISYTCSVCAVSYTYAGESAKGHIFGNWTEVKKLTCEEPGIYQRICTVCFEKQTNVAEPIGHSYSSEWTVVKQPTCTEDGSQAHQCVFCEDFTDITPIPATGHSYSSEWTTLKLPTCTEDGIKAHQCVFCEDFTDITPISATGHSFKTTTTKATTANDGKIVTSCTVCSYVSKTEKIYKASKINLSKTSFVYSGNAQKPTVTVKDSAGNTINSKYYTVSYSGSCKSVGTYTAKITFTGNYTSSKTLNFTIVPKAPASLKASQTTAAITLSWEKVTGAGVYTVYMYNAKTKKYEKKTSVTANSASIKKLSAGTTYKFKVIAADKTGKIKSAYSSVLTTATKPKAPTIKVKSAAKKATVSWSKVSGATGYTVYYSTSKNSAFKKLGTTTKTNYTASKLTSKKTYYFKVVANKKISGTSINSAYSAVKSAKIK